MATERKIRDAWDKAAVVASLLVPISVAIVYILGMYFLHSQQAAETEHRDRQQVAEAKSRLLQQAAETRGRLYVELQTSREKADSDLRKSMFDTVITTFLKRESREPTDLILTLELLAYNFHEVIDLGPLFKHVETMLRPIQPEELREQYGKRLERAAAEVTDKQLAALKDASTTAYDDVFFDELKEHPEGIRLFEQSKDSGNGNEGIIQLAKTTNEITFAQVDVLGADQKHKELRIRLWVYHVTASAIKKEKAPVLLTEVDIVSKVSFYDFPMIDNTRLANGRRIAVVLRSWEPGRADIALVYFPGSRASLKEKPYYEELIEQLHPNQMEKGS